MARHLLSFLGTADYQETTYQYREDTCSSKFVLHALLSTVCKDWGQQAGDKITVFITDEARAKNWVDPDSNKEQKSKDNQQAPKGLETYLTEHFQQKKEMGKLRYGVDIQTIDIVKGTNEVEIWKLFNQLTSPILKDDELYLDVTNSFRAIPLLMSSAAIFARSIQGAKIQAIYYAHLCREILSHRLSILQNSWILSTGRLPPSCLSRLEIWICSDRCTRMRSSQRMRVQSSLPI